MKEKKICLTGADARQLCAAADLQTRLGFVLSDDGLPVRLEKRNEPGLTVARMSDTAVIAYAKPVQMFRGLGLLCEHFDDATYRTEQQPAFETLTLMADNSRNGVMNMTMVRDFVQTLAILGYDELQLYTEDTFELKGHPYFGRYRGRFSAQEIREIDAYCAAFGIALVPCIQTLAHLNAIFKWPVYDAINDYIDILMAENEDTYAFIDDIFASVAEMFTSRKINVGMDEAHMVGTGGYLRKFGYKDRYAIMIGHMRRVSQIAAKYGFTMYMWSDMLIRPAFGDNDKQSEISGPISIDIPDNVHLIYWDYFSDDVKYYDKHIRKHKQVTERLSFAGGCWKWVGQAPLNKTGLARSRAALASCAANGVREVLATVWSDNGAECPLYAVLPQIILFAEYNYTGDGSDDRLNACMHSLFDAQLADFCDLDLPNELIEGKAYDNSNPCKYFLYNDPLLGIADYYASDPSFGPLYAQYAVRLKAACRRNKRYRYIFACMAALCDLLSVKYDVGWRLKQAYDRHDIGELSRLSDRLRLCLTKLRRYYAYVKMQWGQEYKPFGREVLDIRFGGLRTRLEEAVRTVDSYLAGKTDCIPELEEPRLPYNGLSDEKLTYMHRWDIVATASVLTDYK